MALRPPSQHSIRRAILVIGIAAVGLWVKSLPLTGQELDKPRPIDAFQSLQVEELTWMEVRDLVRSGFTRVIVPTGGVEQSGPFLALNKHDRIVKTVATRAAALVGHTLVAPVVSFVPEGNITPPSGHMIYPGTISVSEPTFVALLHDIGSSLISAGFTDIILVGDSGDSQAGLQAAAEKLSVERGREARVTYLSEFYDYRRVEQLLKDRGFPLTPESFHETLPFTLELLAIDPTAARYQQRRKAGLLTINGTSISDLEAMAALGKEIIQNRAESIARAIEHRDHTTSAP